MPSPTALARSCDAAGLAFSGLCLLHCVALPIISSVLPLAGLGEAEWLHLTFAAFTLAATLGIVVGCRPVGLRFLTAAALGNALVFWAVFAAPTEMGETLATVLGASILIAAHSFRLAANIGRRASC